MVIELHVSHFLEFHVHLVNKMWILNGVLAEAHNIRLAIGVNDFWLGTRL